MFAWIMLCCLSFFVMNDFGFTAAGNLMLVGTCVIACKAWIQSHGIYVEIRDMLRVPAVAAKGALKGKKAIVLANSSDSSGGINKVQEASTPEKARSDMSLVSPFIHKEHIVLTMLSVFQVVCLAFMLLVEMPVQVSIFIAAMMFISFMLSSQCIFHMLKIKSMFAGLHGAKPVLGDNPATSKSSQSDEK